MIVIGAGPAGSVAAYAAAARGLRVALVDQRRFPRDKSCGDGIGPGGSRLLQRLRLGHVLADATAISRLCIAGPDGTQARSEIPTVDGESQHGYVMARTTFDDRLFRAACQAGAEDYSGYKLHLPDGGDTRGDACRIVTVRRTDAGDGSGEIKLSCRLLIGADGAYSAVRRLLRVPAHPEHATLLAMRAYADVPADFEPRLMFEFSRDLLPGYGWIFPNGSGSVNVGVGLPLASMRSASIGSKSVDIRDRLARFVDGARSLGLKIGELRGHRSHHLPTASNIPRLSYPRAALVGDSAAMINPLSGEGIVYAMTAAAALVERLPNELGDNDALDDALRSYELWYRDTYGRHMRANHWATRIMTRPGGASWAVRAAHRSPEVMAAAVKLLFGLGHIPRRALAKGLVHAALRRW